MGPSLLKVLRLAPLPLGRVIWVKLEAIWGAWVPLRLCGVTAGSAGRVQAPGPAWAMLWGAAKPFRLPGTSPSPCVGQGRSPSRAPGCRGRGDPGAGRGSACVLSLGSSRNLTLVESKAPARRKLSTC